MHGDALARGSWAKSLALLCLLVSISVINAGLASADVARYGSYRGPEYQPGETHLTPTAAKPQNKLWWYAGRWWTLLLGTDDAVRVASLQPDHTWAATSAVVSRAPLGIGDVVADGPRVHVLTRTSDGLHVRFLKFNPSREQYRVVKDRDVVVATRGSNTAGLALDSRGRLWAAYIRAGQVWVSHSTLAARSWQTPYVVSGPRPLADGEITDIVAFDERIGVVWSDQRRDRFHFAVHRDERPDSAWVTEVALAGRGLVDDHVSTQVVREAGEDTVLVAVKTSLGDRNELGNSPLVLVLRRSDEGEWSEREVATVDDNWTRPVIAADVSGTVYVVARRAGGIVMKSALSRDLVFPPGPGTVLMSSPAASLTDPTVPSQAVDPTCGVVVLASDTRRNQYWHAELALDGSEKTVGKACRPAARTVPVPDSVVATAQKDGVVRISWSDPGDSEWTPAGSVSNRRYVVMRDGARVGTTAATTFIDRPRNLGSHEYRVRAVGSAGQQSAASNPVRLRIPADSGFGFAPLIRRGAMALIVILAAVLVGGGYAMSRALRRRRLEHTRRQVYGAAMAIPLMPAPGGRHARRTSPAVVTSESGEPRPGRRRRELSPTVPGPRTEGD